MPRLRHLSYLLLISQPCQGWVNTDTIGKVPESLPVPDFCEVYTCKSTVVNLLHIGSWALRCLFILALWLPGNDGKRQGQRGKGFAVARLSFHTNVPQSILMYAVILGVRGGLL